MLKYIFVIALMLHVCVYAENNTSEATTLKLKCIDGTFERAKLLYDQFNKTLTSYIQKKDSESLANLNNTFILFTTVVNETCAGGKLPSLNTSFFIDLIEFAIKDDKYSKLINNKGNLCVDSMKDDLQKCVFDNLGTPAKAAATNVSDLPRGAGGEDVKVTGALGEHGHTDIAPAGSQTTARTAGTHTPVGVDGNNNARIAEGFKRYYYSLFQSLLKMAYLEFNELNCDKARDIKLCVTSAMKIHNTTCTLEHSEFVDSLFDFSLTKCPKAMLNPVKKNGANTILFNAVVILLPFVGTMLI